MTARSTARAIPGTIVVTLLLGGASVAAPAAVAPAGPGGRAAIEDRGLETAPTQDELREAMQQLMIARLKRALRLTPEQEGRVVPRMHALLENRREYGARRRAALLRLRSLIIDDSSDDRAIGRELKNLQDLDAQFRERQQGLKDAVDSELTARQQARFLFFEQRFRRAMQRRLQGGATPPPLRGRRPDAGGPGALQDPFGDVDEPEQDE